MPAQTDLLAYLAVGNLLKRWRIAKYRSANALCAAAGFSFSYGVYAAYERGEDLPPPRALVEIAKFLGEDPREAMVVWTQCQMPTPELAQYFSVPNILGDRMESLGVRFSRDTRPYAISSNSIPLNEFESTWIFDAPERKAIEANPWLIGFFISMGMTYPEPVTYEVLGLTDAQSLRHFTGSYLKRWIEDERILVTKEGFKLAKQYFHIPKNEQWQEVRRTMLDDALKATLPQLTPEALKARQCHRTLTTRILTARQREAFMEKLAGLEHEFFSVVYAGNKTTEAKQACTLVMLLAPRKLALPGKVKGARGAKKT